LSTRIPTLVGFCAVLTWAFLATLTVAASPVPPFQLNAMCFGIGAVVGIFWIARSPAGFAVLRGQPNLLWFTGILGLSASHSLYFIAMSLGPPAQTSLIAYLWPLLIVLFSALLPGEILRPTHVIGGFVALFGASLVVLGDTGLSGGFHIGYLVALIYACVWAGYSVMSRRFRGAPVAVVMVYCAGAAFLSAILHLLFETSAAPASPLGWLAIVALGAGPLGVGFYLWDHGMKHGNIQLLGVAAFAAPALSTVLLVVVGIASFSWSLVLAATLVALGAAIASR
jgi:drug/metabolite transporter (DMT)-like permease